MPRYSLCWLEPLSLSMDQTCFGTALEMWTTPEFRLRVALLRERLGLPELGGRFQ